MLSNNLDGVADTGLTQNMARPKKETPKWPNFGLKMEPVFKEIVQDIGKKEEELFESSVIRALFMRGLAAYIRDNKLKSRDDSAKVREYVEQFAHASGHREVDVDTGSKENGGRTRRPA